MQFGALKPGRRFETSPIANAGVITFAIVDKRGRVAGGFRDIHQALQRLRRRGIVGERLVRCKDGEVIAHTWAAPPRASW